jgi:hypothetical protein
VAEDALEGLRLVDHHGMIGVGQHDLPGARDPLDRESQPNNSFARGRCAILPLT